MEEIFIDMVEFPGYKISNYGRVYSNKRDKFLSIAETKYHTRKDGRNTVCICINGIRKYILLDFYVYKYFINSTISNNDIIHHKDFDFTNNNINNLEIRNIKSINEIIPKIQEDEKFINMSINNNYLISNYGRIYDILQNDFVKQFQGIDGYDCGLNFNGFRKNFRIHRLVAEHFVDGNKNGYVARKDGNHFNNYYKNLYWIKKGRIKSLVGQKFGRLTVLNLDEKRIFEVKRKYIYWICKCSCDNKFVSINSSGLKSGQIKSCGCLHKEAPHVIRKNFGYEEITGRHWARIKRNAKNAGREFTISIKYIWDCFLKQNRKCCLTGCVLIMESPNRKIYHNASLDRIDSSKGYIEGNVQWVHKDINIMKSDHKQDDFINLCKLVTFHDIYHPEDEVSL